MNLIKTLFFIFCFLTIGCQSEMTKKQIDILKIQLLSFNIELSEPQAVTNEGISVLAPDINFGKIYFNFATNFKTEKFVYKLFLSTDETLSDNDHLIASAHCNIDLIPCYPIKQQQCQIIQSMWLECLLKTAQIFDLSSISDYPKSGLTLYLILKTCPWGITDENQCDWQARPLRIEKKCSQYKMYECLDQEPLEIKSLEITTLTNDVDNTPLLTYEKNIKQKLWIQWQSSWLTKAYLYKLEILQNINGIEQHSETLTEGICNDNISCYPSRSILCEYYAKSNSGELTCQDNSAFIYINQIASNHPFETVDLKIKLTVYDDNNQIEKSIMETIRIQGEN